MKVFALLFLAAIWMPGAMLGQDARGRITGRVLDPSGAPVPNVSVAATENATQVKVVGNTNAAGSYDLPYLDPGTYTLTVSAPGFSSYERTNLEVRVADRLTIDVQLAVGSTKDSVVVSSQVPQVDTGSAWIAARIW